METPSTRLSYAEPRYASSLHELGESCELALCGGWILVRKIPGSRYRNAIGCCPLFACRDWTKLHKDLEQVNLDFVSLTVVTDPLAGVAPAYLEQCFGVFRPFDIRYLVDLSYPLRSFIGRIHRKNARKSLDVMDVEVCHQPVQYLDERLRLYDNLIDKHNIKGLNAFSAKCFEIQLRIPRITILHGRREGRIVGATLVLVQDEVAHSHLSAYTPEGYKIRASYGTYGKALVYGCEQGILYFNLDGTAGIKENPLDGLAEFKRGWSNERRMTYFCRRVFDWHKYESICQQYQIANVDYFPAHRAGEFNAYAKKHLS